MRAMTLLMITTILAIPLAGCVDSGDGPQFELSPEEIEDLIDANLDDFLNNSSLTIVNNNYQNNTYNNGGSLFSSSGNMVGTAQDATVHLNETFLIRGDAFPQANTITALNLASAKVCVGTGTTLEQNLADYNTIHSIGMDIVPVADDAEATTKLADGSCDAMIFTSKTDAEQKIDDFYYGSTSGHPSCDDCELWIAAMSDGSEISTASGTIGNSMSVVFNQSKNEMLTGFKYLFAQITLSGLCEENESDCEPFEHKFSTADNSYQSLVGELVTTCSDEVEFVWRGDIYYVISDLETGIHNKHYFFPGTGLDCEHKFSFIIDPLVYSSLIYEYNIGEQELSWSDWTYSLVWESVPIEN